MSNRKQKLELTWIGKEVRPKLEPRILLEDPSRSYCAAQRVTDQDIFDNRLIFGDNLLALKALEAEFAGKVKCIYIDPPYNTGSAFEQYDDGIEHSLWLSLLSERVSILKNLLSPDGSLWVSIDDNECAYLRVLLDEVFGRGNFVATIIWEKRTTRENRRALSFKHDYVLLFAKDKNKFQDSMNGLPLSEEVLARYKNPDNDPRGPWQSISALAQAGHATASQFYTLTTPAGKKLDPPAGNCWRLTEKRMKEEIASGRIWFGADGTNVPRMKRYLNENPDDALTPETIWYAKDVGTNDDAKKHVNMIFKGIEAFETPKPEGLIERILQIATKPGDLVLDSFAGSGTTGAAAQKMGRRWIMVELGEHCHTHIIPRLMKVIDAEDPGGVTEATNWKGGGGFRYFKLAPSLLMKDKWDRWVISKEFNATMLAEALCKLEGFRYEPSDSVFWMQGRSTETDFLYCTTQTLSVEQLNQLSEEVSSERTLLVLCSAFRGKVDRWPNLTVKKIPRAVQHKCEWGHDDYSLKVENLPKPSKKQRTSLFDDEGDSDA